MCQTRRTALRGMISCGVCSDVNIQEVSLFFTPLRGKLHRGASVHMQKSNPGWKLMRELWWIAGWHARMCMRKTGLRFGANIVLQDLGP